MLVKTFWRNVGFNLFSEQMLVQLFSKKSLFNFLWEMLFNFLFEKCCNIKKIL
jgi:hypothetical protein